MLRRFKFPSLKTLGIEKLVFDLKHRRYRFRQFVGILFLIVLAFAGNPALLGQTGWLLYVAGLVAIVPGLLIRLWASGIVKKDKQLATTGPYAYVRHPLYVGNHLITLGYCLTSGLWWSFPVWLVIALIFYPGTIRHEDTVLHGLFGKAWEDWSAKRHALIPSLTPYRPGEKGEWSLTQSWHNGEPIILALLAAGAVYLGRGF